MSLWLCRWRRWRYRDPVIDTLIHGNAAKARTGMTDVDMDTLRRCGERRWWTVVRAQRRHLRRGHLA